MNPPGRAEVSLRNLLIEFRISLARLMMQLLRVNARMDVAHVGSSRSTHVYHFSDLDVSIIRCLGLVLRGKKYGLF